MAMNRTTRRLFKDAPVPVRNLPGENEIDEILRSVVNGTRQDVHAAIETILRGWPGRKRGELRERLRWLRNSHREAPWRHTVWNDEDIGFSVPNMRRDGRERAGRSKNCWLATRIGSHGRFGTRQPNWDS